jgi:hypothetical protein
MPLCDGELQRCAAGAVSQADEARAGEGQEEGRDGSMAEGTGSMEAREAADTVCCEQKSLPARLDQGFCNLNMPPLASVMEARASVLKCLEKQQHLPSRLDQSVCNRKMPLLARDMETRASVLVCLEKKLLPSCLDE